MYNNKAIIYFSMYISHWIVSFVWEWHLASSTKYLSTMTGYVLSSSCKNGYQLGNNKLFCWGLCFICSNASQENWFDHMKLKVYGKLPGKNKVKWQTLMVEVLFVQSHVTQKHIYCIKREYFQIGILKLSQTKWLKEIKKSFFYYC